MGSGGCLGASERDVLSSTQGLAGAKNLTCVITLIHKSICVFFSCP